MTRNIPWDHDQGSQKNWNPTVCVAKSNGLRTSSRYLQNHHMGHRQYLQYIAPSHQFLKSVYDRFSGFGNIVFVKSVLSFSKPQLNFQKIKTSRILLPLRLNFGCSSHICAPRSWKKTWKKPMEIPAFPFRLPGLPGQVDRLLTAAGSSGSLAQGPWKWRFHPRKDPDQQKWMDDPILGLGNGWVKLYEMINYVFFFCHPFKIFDGIIDFFNHHGSW